MMTYRQLLQEQEALAQQVRDTVDEACTDGQLMSCVHYHGGLAVSLFVNGEHEGDDVVTLAEVRYDDLTNSFGYYVIADSIQCKQLCKVLDAIYALPAFSTEALQLAPDERRFLLTDTTAQEDSVCDI